MISPTPLPSCVKFSDVVSSVPANDHRVTIFRFEKVISESMEITHDAVTVGIRPIDGLIGVMITHIRMAKCEMGKYGKSGNTLVPVYIVAEESNAASKVFIAVQYQHDEERVVMAKVRLSACEENLQVALVGCRILALGEEQKPAAAEWLASTSTSSSFLPRSAIDRALSWWSRGIGAISTTQHDNTGISRSSKENCISDQWRVWGLHGYCPAFAPIPDRSVGESESVGEGGTEVEAQWLRCLHLIWFAREVASG